jgi:isochorismate synthase
MLLPAGVIAAVAAQLTDVDPGPVATTRFAAVPVEVAPLDLVRAGAAMFGSARYLRRPDGATVGGLGTAARVTAAGPDRFVTLDRLMAELPTRPDVVTMVGFSFAADGPRSPEWVGFAAAEAVVPAVAVVADHDGSRLVVAVPPGSHPGGTIAALRDLPDPGPPRLPGLGDHSVRAVPSGSDWCRSVDEAVAAIGDGALSKVVLARAAVVTTEMTIDPFETVHHLAVDNPHTYCYGWQLGGSAFVGASPEMLVGKRGDTVLSHPHAGSAPRGDGDEEDRAVGAALMASAKDREEHAAVVDDIAARLSAVTTELTVPVSPSLVVTSTVQHLSTHVSGTLRPGVSLLDLVDRLHPTPAVGGVPRAEAIAFIDKLETIDRGWYAGGVGWVDGAGDGEVAIALRCGLLDGLVARLYAGNGIVADSDPEGELVETRWKLRPLLDLLTAT